VGHEVPILVPVPILTSPALVKLEQDTPGSAEELERGQRSTAATGELVFWRSRGDCCGAPTGQQKSRLPKNAADAANTDWTVLKNFFRMVRFFS